MDALLIPTFFCPKAWEGMTGNEATRHCSYCNKHVHNLDAMSVSERLALLSSPAAQICARYKIAIRRPKPGRKESYVRHLAKYGLGVAAAGSAILVLWEMTAPDGSSFFRAVRPGWSETNMSWHYYEETQSITMGMVVQECPALPPFEIADEASPDRAVDVKLDPVFLKQLQDHLKPMPPERVAYLK
jgi:hypothetical protein